MDRKISINEIYDTRTSERFRRVEKSTRWNIIWISVESFNVKINSFFFFTKSLFIKFKIIISFNTKFFVSKWNVNKCQRNVCSNEISSNKLVESFIYIYIYLLRCWYSKLSSVWHLINVQYVQKQHSNLSYPTYTIKCINNDLKKKKIYNAKN